MRPTSLLLLRVSLGILMAVWGIDKIVNTQHGVEVAARFYGGMSFSSAIMQAFGWIQLGLGAAVVLGLARRYAYPALFAVTGTTLLGVWKSVLDPLGLYLQGGQILFYPSLIIFAGALVLWSFRDEDVWSLDARRSRPSQAS
jgi:uncharacterized membrane protein YphA (DoxX/SURF4 family)